MRRVLGLLAAFLCLSFVIPTAGMAAPGVILGPTNLTGPDEIEASYPIPITLAQVGVGGTTFAAGQSGTITRWRLNAAAGGGHAKLVVLRGTGCDCVYEVVAESEEETVVAGINEFDTSLRINAGDYIGITVEANTEIYASISASNTYISPFALTVGLSAVFDPSGGNHLFNASMTPDGTPTPTPTPQPVYQPIALNTQVTGADGQRAANPAASPMREGAAIGVIGANMNFAESVYFNNVPAKTWWIDGFEKLTVVVPAGLPEGPVQVRVGGVAGVTEDTPSTTVFITRGGQIATVAEASQSPVTRTAGKAKPARKVKPNRSKTKQSRKVARLTDGGGVHGAC